MDQRRRRAGLAVALVVVVAAAVGVRMATDDSQPAPKAHGTGAPQRGGLTAPSRTGVDDGPRPPRPLTYADGQTIHLGARTIDTHRDLLSLDVTDDGAVFTTITGGVWFTDGRTIDRVGTTSPGHPVDRGVQWGPSGRPDHWVVSDNSGSLIAWFEYFDPDPPEIVVYDTRAERQVARLPITRRSGCEQCARILSVHNDSVFWTDSPWYGAGGDDEGSAGPHLFRETLSTGKEQKVSAAGYLAALRTTPRMLVLGDSFAQGTVTDGVGQAFVFAGQRLIPRDRDSTTVYDTATHQPIHLRPPAGYPTDDLDERLLLTQWLDDDRFVLLDATGWDYGHHDGEDLLVCRISAGQCTDAVRRPTSAGSPIVPEFGTPGAGAAEDRAIRQQESVTDR